MTGDHKTDPESGKAQLAGVSRDKPSIDELSRQLGERLVRQRTVDPAAAASARRAALEAYDLARERRLIAGLSVVLALTVGASVAYFVSTIESRPVTPPPSAAARAEPAQSPENASAASVPVSPDSPSPATTVADTAAPEPPAPTQVPPATDSQPAPVEAMPSEAPLQSDAVREIQAKMRSLGFNPGPVDGTAGRMTEVAVRRYQQTRSQPQTGEIDRRLLEQLRQEPAPAVAPQVAQRGARPDARAARSPAPRRSDPFEPVRSAGNRVGQWLDSLRR